ncbi:MAG: FAD-dependent oxidoreductase [Rhodospirillaceae bacterium]|jgi:pyruvate/2-oxoglutarate dehydrogenase complex dihydrolipoamide dehydrogenase (E3) component|nr:FAD-dependent oxidoreductase [Rhodospirillaceae bacterium]MBT4219151.1 FAD-dependent oxidoreductase [Rhodospirillaceae bacterium]MBT5013574.1 FAD-dependent oxidoreductase [Rhodospirillaceae bacterium]MBT5308894.1 FAD-dependent oxidoreductase [Rhodospirillaceae bacterium]MBT7355444.1 FAD-dependent oxidoreductase [Rhodospirillaceae bacterium]
MADILKVDICVVGAGSGGLSVAAGASQMGASVVLIEKHLMGGDCLNTGCVPSKALLAAGHAAEAVRHAPGFGVSSSEPVIDAAAVYGHVRATIDGIAPTDSVERFEGLGVKVIEAAGAFTGPKEVTAGGTTIRARRFVVATGSRAFVPPIPGINDVPYLTNETIFDGPDLPEHLLVIGGGPIGIELAQAHRHLGAKVTVLEMAGILPNDDPELVDVVRGRLLDDGIDVREGVTVTGVEKSDNGVTVVIQDGEVTRRIDGSHLLVAAGRAANVDGLGLDLAGIDHSPRGIAVDARLRTSNKKVFAIGDVAGGLQFTHVAGYHAGIVIRNALFRLPAKTDHSAVPWVTYTSPELSQVGLNEAAARSQHGEIRVLRWPYAENDRARAERLTDGLIKVITTPKGKILGAGIVGAQAGELIQPWVLALTKKMKIGDMAGAIAPYPTLGEISKRAAGSFYTPSLFSERTKSIVRFLARFG